MPALDVACFIISNTTISFNSTQLKNIFNILYTLLYYLIFFTEYLTILTNTRNNPEVFRLSLPDDEM